MKDVKLVIKMGNLFVAVTFKWLIFIAVPKYKTSLKFCLGLCISISHIYWNLFHGIHSR